MTDAPGGNPSPGDASQMNQMVSISADVLDQVQDVLKGGRIRAVRIKLGQRTLKEIPVEAAALTAILVAVAAVVISQLRIEVERG